MSDTLAESRLPWRLVPVVAKIWAEKLAATADDCRQRLLSADMQDFLSLHADASSNRLLVKLSGWAAEDTEVGWYDRFSDSDRDLTVIREPSELPPGGDWVPLYVRSKAARAFLEKHAKSPLLSTLAMASGNKPGLIPGAPKPLAALLAGGLLGAGLGYGSGWVAERLFPEKWEKGRLPRTLAMLGAATGAAPAGLRMLNNQGRGVAINSDVDMQPSETTTDGLTNRLGNALLAKSGSRTGYDGAWPAISVPQFTARVWQDPVISRQLNSVEQATAAGLVQGASALQGGSPWVTPGDLAMMTAGMGSGYLSGAIVGRALGALMGLPEDSQKRLRDAGLWAGVVKTVIPIAFGD